MADYESGGSQPVTGASRNLEEVTAAELMRDVPNPARPLYQVTRFPVTIEEFERLNEAAKRPEPVAFAPGEGPIEDSEASPRGSEFELPEDDSAPSSLAPPINASFEGIPQTAFTPPDCTIAAGPNHVVVAVNSDLAGYGKTGSLLFRWSLTTLFSPVLPPSTSIFDPHVAYDHYQNRWIVLADGRKDPASSWMLVAVSQGANPAGPYWVWALDATLDGSSPTTNWADYSKLGFDTQGIYICSNMFQFGGGFRYAKLRILSKAELYAGGVGPSHAIKWYDFWNLRNPDNSLAFTVQPAMHFRGLGGNPPAYLINALWPSGTTLTLWTLSNPIGYWIGGAATLSRDRVNCLAYDLPPDAIQPGTPARIETNDSRLLSTVYQHAGNTQRLWACHTTKHTWPGEPEARSTVQFYEIDVPSKKVVQQNKYGATGKYYFYPAIQTDLSRRAFVVFGRSSGAEFAELRQTGRRVGDPPNTLQGSALVKAGLAPYTRGRWGDYFGICREGGAPMVVWMSGCYANTGNTWATRTCAVTMPPPTMPEITLPTVEKEELRRALQKVVQDMVEERATLYEEKATPQSKSTADTTKKVTRS